MAASSNQLYSFRCGEQIGLFFKRTRAAGIVSTSNPGHLWPGFFCAWKKALVPIAHKHYHSHK
jgi:hypothetical protein